MPWVVGIPEEDLGKGHVWDNGLRMLENHLLIGMCLGWFLWESNMAPRKSQGSNPRSRALM